MENVFSQFGKEVLIKAMVLSIPTYAMSSFKLPATLCHQLELMAVVLVEEEKGKEKTSLALWQPRPTRVIWWELL